MEELMNNIEWMPTLIAFVLAFGLGWLWYSPLMFLKPWAAGAGIDLDGEKQGMAKPMVLQALGTLLLSIIVGMTVVDGHAAHAVMVALTVVFFVMSSNFYKSSECNPPRIEAAYIFAMVIVMIAVHMML